MPKPKRSRGSASRRTSTSQSDIVLLQQELDLFVNGPVVLFKWRNLPQWPVEYVSGNVHTVLGYTVDEFVSGQVLYADLIHPADLHRVVEEVALYSRGTADRFEHQPYRLIRRTGEVVWVVDHTTIWRDAAGAITHYLGYLVDITALKKTEEALRESQERLELAVRGAELGTWDWNVQTGEVVFNDRWAAMLDYTTDEIAPHVSAWQNLMHPAEEQAILHALDAHLAGRTSLYRTEQRLRTKSGDWKWVLDTGKVITRDEHGRPLRAAGVHLDITPSKQIEHALRHSESQLRLAQHLAQLGSWEWNLATQALIWSDEVYRIFGVLPGEFVPSVEAFEAFIHPDDRRDFLRRRAEMLAETRTAIIDHRIVRRDGEVRHVQERAQVILNECGQASRVTGTVQDITARKQLEETLRQNEAQLRALIDHAPLSIITMDLDGRVQLWNAAAERTYGWTAAEVRGTLLPAVPPDWQAPFNSFLAQLQRGESIPYTEVPGVRKDGTEIQLALAGAPLRDADGHVTALLGMSADITEHKHAEELVRRHNDFLTALHATTLDLLNRREIADLLQTIVERAAAILDAPVSELMLKDGDQLVVHACTPKHTVLKGDRSCRDEAILSWQAHDTRQPVTLDDYAAWPDRRTLYAAIELHAVADFPIMAGDDCIGVLALGRTQPDRPFTLDEIHQGRLFSQLAALMLDNANLYAAALHELTERKQMETALRQSEEKYRTLVQTLSEGVALNELIYDEHGDAIDYRILEVNPAFHTVTNYDGPIEGRLATEIYGLSRDYITAFWRAHRGTATTRYTEFNSPRADRYFFVATSPLADDRFVTSFFDITERKHAEEALRESQSLYHSLVEVSPLCICRKDQAGRFTFANRRFLEETQISLADLIGKTDFDLHPPELARKYQEDDRAVMTSGQVTELIEERDLGAGGATSAVQSIKVPIYDGAGQINGVQISFWDITERLRMTAAEREQRTLAEALRDTAAAVNSTLDLTEVFDRILANVERVVPHEAANIMLIDAAGLARIARHRGFVERGLELQVEKVQFRAADVPNLRHMLHTGRPLAIPDTRGYAGWINTPDIGWALSHVGAPLRVKECIIGFLNADSRTANFYTEQHAERLQAFADQVAVAVENARLYEQVQQYSQQLEERVHERTIELVAANERLTELDRLKDEFLSRVSHELRTPLATIKLYLSLVERGRPEKREAYLQTLKHESDRLDALIEEVLTFSHLNRHTPASRLKPLEMRVWLNDQRERWEQMCTARGLAFRLDAPPDTPRVSVDADLLIQAVNRLMVNAVNYTARGSVAVTAGAREAEGRQWAIVSVQDTGPGIAPDELPRIFQRFYRGRAAANFKTPGVGVGLSISREIAEKLGGRLTVETQVGAGSTFTLWLPVPQ